MMKVIHDAHTEAHKTTWEKENKKGLHCMGNGEVLVFSIDTSNKVTIV